MSSISGRPPRDWGQLVARLACALFALLGTLPLVLGLLTRSEAARAWAVSETRATLQRQFELNAAYDARLQLWPLGIRFEGVEVASNDGDEPALVIDRMTLSPRIFSLLAGRVDIGDVEVEGARARLVVADGRVRNVDYRLPESRPSSDSRRVPFSSLSLSDAELVLAIDGIDLRVSAIDLDVFPDRESGFEIAVRAGESHIRVSESRYPPTGDVRTLHWDGDTMCQLDARLRIEEDTVLVRRLSLLGVADLDPARGIAPGCGGLDEDVPGRIALGVHQLRIDPNQDGRPWLVQGATALRAPVDLLNRWLPDAGPFEGWLSVDGQLRYDGSSALPQFQGRVELGELKLGPKYVMQGAKGALQIERDRILVPELAVRYGSGTVDVRELSVAPFEANVPFLVKSTRVSRVPFADMMKNLDVTEDTVAPYIIDSAIVSDFVGTLSPVRLDGRMVAEVTDFEIFRGSHRSPNRQHMLGFSGRGVTRGTFSVRDDSVQFNNQHIQFGHSSLHATVHLGFESWLRVETWASRIDLADLSPLVNQPMKGILELDTKMDGAMADPLLVSQISIQGLEFGGFPVGDLERAKVTFRPLWIELADARLEKGKSQLDLPKVRFDFETGADLDVQAQVRSSALGVEDFLAMWKFDEDPRWRDMAGATAVEGNVHYVLGGPSDRCGEGTLDVSAKLDVQSLDLFGESYDGGHAQLRFRWLDTAASYHGMELDVPALKLAKGGGTILGNLRVSEGATVRGNLVATSVPLAELDALGDLQNVAQGTLSAVIEIGGTLDEMTAEAQVDVGALAMGRSQLEPSVLHVALEPAAGNRNFVADRVTACGRKIPTAYDASDENALRGVFVVSGTLFGGQVELEEFRITRQDRKVARGKVLLRELDLGPFSEINTDVALMRQRPTGKLSASVDIERWPLDDFAAVRASARIERLQANFQTFSATVAGPTSVQLETGGVTLERASVELGSDDRRTTLDVSGSVRDLVGKPNLDLGIALRPVNASELAHLFPGVRRLQGTLEGNLRLSGSVEHPAYAGGFTLKEGLFEFRGSPLSLSEVDVALKLDNAGLSIERATAMMGSGTVSASGIVPLRGFRPERFSGQLEARDIAVPVTAGVDLTVDADLELGWEPSGNDEEPSLPKIGGEVSIKSFEYSRAVTMNADLASLGRPKRTEFESYDPDKDVVELDVLVTSKGALRLNNNLLEAQLALEPPGLRLTGTNQRFGLRGAVKVVPGGRIRFRRNDFEVQSGEVQFDDPTRIAPRVDVTAVTDYRRFSSTTQAGVASSGSATTSAQSGAGSTAGQWRIRMHAYGDAENLKLDLTSQPRLSQDDIFLLLTVGLTRAEMDQAQSASVGESVALEALGSLTGADSAVSEAIPAIDEFRFGSSYSARTGRTEPTVTVGKRLSERIRAYVTSGISESREVRSNLEWRLKPGVSVEGSYDNVNDVSSSNVGNLGADIRWRLEFE